MVSKFYKALQLVREDQARVRLATVEAIQQIRTMQDRQVATILKRQRETENYYEKRLKKAEKDLREARKRIVERRNGLTEPLR